MSYERLIYKDYGICSPYVPGKPTERIRIASVKDIPRICELISLMTPTKYQDNYQFEEEKKRYETLILPNPGYRLLVAEYFGGKLADSGLGHVIGTAMVHLQYKLSYDCGVAAHLEDLVVDPEWRSIGIGEELVEAAIDFANENKCYKIMLTCLDRTVPYYEKLGFVKWDYGMRKSLHRLDVLNEVF